MATCSFVTPNILVDRLVTKSPVHQTKATYEPNDLFWAELFTKQSSDDLEIGVGIVSIPSRSPASRPGTSLRFGGPIRSICHMTAVSIELPVQGGMMALQDACYRTHRKALLEWDKVYFTAHLLIKIKYRG